MRRLYNADVGSEAASPEQPFANVLLSSMLLIPPGGKKDVREPATENEK